MALVSETFNALVDWNDPLVAQERDLAAAAAPPAPLRNPFAKPLFKSDADRRAFQDGPFMRALRNSKIILRDREADRRQRRADRDPEFAPRDDDYDAEPVQPSVERQECFFA